MIFRTYKLSSITQVKIWMLNWKKLNIYNTSTEDVAIIDKGDKLQDIIIERKILENNLGISLSNIRSTNTSQLKQAIIQRFSSEENFIKVLRNLELLVDEEGDDVVDKTFIK